MLSSSSRRRASLSLLVFLGMGLVLTGCFLLPNRPPLAAFTVHYNVTEDIMVVDLDASQSSDPDGDAITSYMWTFGDQDTQIITPLTVSATVPVEVLRVRYPDEDEYTITLLVIDERGAASVPVSQTIMLPVIIVDPTQ